MYYFSSKPSNAQITMNMNCVHYHYDGSPADTPSKKIAFHHHNHEAFEILAIKRGNLRVTVEEREYILNEGDIVIINPFRLHFGEWIENKHPSEYICITFGISTWLSFRNSVIYDEKNRLIEEKSYFDEIYYGDNNKEIYYLIEEISSLFSKKDAASECRIASNIYRLMAKLFENHYNNTPQTHTHHRNTDFMTEVSKYLDTHYTENISTCDIADNFYMTIPSFCYIFKKNFGMTFLSYLSKYRILRATELYKENQTSLSDLATMVGFDDYCYFSRSFRKHMGKSPSIYFGKWKK